MFTQLVLLFAVGDQHGEGAHSAHPGPAGKAADFGNSQQFLLPGIPIPNVNGAMA